MEESHEEATEKEVERILGLLQAYHREDRKYKWNILRGPVCSLLPPLRITMEEEGNAALNPFLLMREGTTLEIEMSVSIALLFVT